MLLSLNLLSLNLSTFSADQFNPHFRNGSLPSRFSGKKEVEKRERNNTPGRAFSADRFTAKHLTMLGLFGVHLSIRRAEKKEKKDFLLVVLSSGRKTRAVRGTGEHQKSQKKPAMEEEKKTRARVVFSSFSRTRPTRTVDHRGMGEPHVRAEDLDRQAIIVTSKKA